MNKHVLVSTSTAILFLFTGKQPNKGNYVKVGNGLIAMTTSDYQNIPCSATFIFVWTLKNRRLLYEKYTRFMGCPASACTIFWVCSVRGGRVTLTGIPSPLLGASASKNTHYLAPAASFFCYGPGLLVVL